MDKARTGQLIIALFFLFCLFLAFTAIAFGMSSFNIFSGNTNVWQSVPTLLLIALPALLVILCLLVYHFWKSKISPLKKEKPCLSDM